MNLDLNRGYNEHHRFNYDPRRIKNFTNGDGAILPYRDKSFEIVLARHVLEHLPEPIKALREWKRVARNRVIIMVPNNPTIEDYETHLYAWSRRALENLCKLIFPEVTVYPNSHLRDLIRVRPFGRLFKTHSYKKPLQRLIGSWFGFQLTAICKVEQQIDKISLNDNNINEIYNQIENLAQAQTSIT